MKLSDFVEVEWRPKAELDLRENTVDTYSKNLDTYILPALGQTQLCDLTRADIEACLSDLRRKGYASNTIGGARAALMTVLRTAVEREFLEKNTAHGIRIREADTEKEREFYSPIQVRKLLTVLPEPCRTIILLAVLTGMRIGEILALRWKRVDLSRGTIEVAGTFSNGRFGPPKTRKSHRAIYISSTLRQILEAHRERSPRNQPDDLVFSTSKGTPLSDKNLRSRVLNPACDAIKEPRVSPHSFRHYARDVAVGSGLGQDRAGHSRPFGS